MATRRYRAPARGMDLDHHAWVYDVLEKEERINELLGVEMGALLGCGYFGCVLETEGPWVVKLTVDPTEGPIWVGIDHVVKQYQERTGEYLAAWPRVREVIELTPGVTTYEGERKLYAIVREAAAPAFTGSAYEPSSTEATKRAIGMSKRLIATGYDPVQEYRNSSFNDIFEWVTEDVKDRGFSGRTGNHVAVATGLLVELLRGLRDYRSIGQDVRSRWLREEGITPEQWRRDDVRDYIRRVLPQIEEAMDPMIDSVEDHLGLPLAALLIELTKHHIVLADLHVFNLGWREHAEIEGDVQPECLMAIDPGATPTTERTAVERRMIANGRWCGT